MREVIVARHDEEAVIGQQVAVDPVPCWLGCGEWRGEITFEPGEGGAEFGLGVGIEPPRAGGIVQLCAELLPGFQIQRGFLRREVGWKINLPVLVGAARLESDKVAQHIIVRTAGGIAGGFDGVSLSGGHDRRKPGRLADKGEARIFRQWANGGRDHPDKPIA